MSTALPDPSTRPPRGRALLVLARSLLTVVVLVVLYYNAPLTARPGAVTALLLLLGLVGLSVLVAWQIRAILRSAHPGLRAVEMLALALPAFLLLFAAGYYVASETAPWVFNEPLTRTDALYFTITVFATVGFGDIAPVAQWMRVVVSLQMVADLLVLGFVLRAVVDAVGRARGRQSG